MLILVRSQQVLWRRYQGLNNSPLVITPINLYTSYGLSTSFMMYTNLLALSPKDYCLIPGNGAIKLVVI